jgi:hemerythrin-like domain-containing protein
MQAVAVDTNGFVLDGYIYMHRAIRNDIANLSAASRRINQLNPQDAAKLHKWFTFFWEMVEVHHTGEDDEVFPTIMQRVPDTKNQMEVLTENHDELDELVEEIGVTLQNLGQDTASREESRRHLVYLTSRFEKEMNEHLDREEQVVIPALARHFSAAEQIAIEKNLKQPPLKRMALLVPWVFSALSEEEQAKGIKMLPLPMRWLYRLSWKKKYAKFTEVLKI